MAEKSIQRTKTKGHGHLSASSLLLIGVTAVGNMTTTREQPALLKDQENGFPSLFFALLILNAPESAAPKQQPWYRKKLFF